MSNFYWDATIMQNQGAFPTMMAIGDSWFWYLFPGGSLINYIGPMVETKSHVILVKGMNGAEAFDYVDGKYAKSINQALKLYGSGLSAVLISGGGNDFAGFNDMRPLLKDKCSKETTAEGCFQAGEQGLDGFLDRMDQYYRKLIGVIYTRTSLDCHIIMHSYDYAIPDGKGVFGQQGWLQPALVNAGVPPDLQQLCVKLLLDRFHKVLLNIVAMDPGHLHLVDSRGTLGAGDWANELHPTGGGFKKIAIQKWGPLLRDIGLAA
ncbi:hypothetical protein os1_20400 [Comamonadaceae bacterium OS-1]|nr:hypothetical protein os1_20400 [Comamonadaceae bacterium OS-1]